ncbi:MAG TPA: hypothetical protein DD417_21115 [Elusimicrobia bacterium]|nr:hypothetical protein [Elusimicrobiota bacterium]
MRIPPLLGTVLTSALFAYGAPAGACSIKPDPRPFSERLAAAPIAFIGVVTAVNAKETRFKIEHALHGVTGTKTTVRNSPPSTCVIQFEVGARWLFAGDMMMDPSIPLGPATEMTETTMGLVLRHDDTRLKFPAEWQACKKDEQCRLVGYGCSVTAAAAAHEPAARAQAWELGGDPRTMNCTDSGVTQLDKPLCVAKKCGAWYIDAN